jgi:hypothetical protein
MWPGAVTTEQYPVYRYGDTTGTYSEPLTWYACGNSKKKPFSLSEFIQNKQRITEAWHVPFEQELLRWRRCGKTNLVLATYFWERTVEYVMKVHLSVDWRWVFKRWVQDLYADIHS